MDAAIMDGATLDAGSVAGVRNVRNPIELAAEVMRNSFADTARHTLARALRRVLNGRRCRRDLGPRSLRVEPEMFRRTFALIAALNARPFCLR